MSLGVIRTGESLPPACSAGCDRARWDGSKAPALVSVVIGRSKLHLCASCASSLHRMLGLMLPQEPPKIRRPPPPRPGGRRRS